MNVLVLTLDHLQAASLGCYGQLRARTPTLDQLAAQSIVFDGHLAENADAAALLHAWTTGRFQFPDSARGRKGPASLGDVLHAAGVAVTALIEPGARQVFAGSGIAPVPVPPGKDGLDTAPSDTSLARLIDAALDVFESTASGPSLVWLHARGAARETVPPWECVLPHTASFAVPGDKPGASHDSADAEAVARERVEQYLAHGVAHRDVRLTVGDSEVARLLNAGAVELLDRQMERLLLGVQDWWGDEPGLIVLAAAQGELLGERAMLPEKEAWLPSEVVQTPLLVHLSADGEPGRRRELVQTVDLLPTLLDALGLTPDIMGCEGRSLLPLVRGENWESRSHVCLGDGLRLGAVRTEEYYLCGPADALRERNLARLRLFVKPDDSWDVSNVVAQSPDAAAELARDWCDFVQDRSGSTMSVSPGTGP